MSITSSTRVISAPGPDPVLFISGILYFSDLESLTPCSILQYCCSSYGGQLLSSAQVRVSVEKRAQKGSVCSQSRTFTRGHRCCPFATCSGEKHYAEKLKVKKTAARTDFDGACSQLLARDNNCCYACLMGLLCDSNEMVNVKDFGHCMVLHSSFLVGGKEFFFCKDNSGVCPSSIPVLLVLAFE